MSAKFKIPFKKGDVFLIDPALIELPADLQGRAYEPDLTDLIASLKTQGQLQPIGIRKDGDKVVAVYGFSRVRALRAVNESVPGEKMLCKCLYLDINEFEAFTRNITENRERNAVSVVDTAINIAKLRDRFGKTLDEIAALYRRSPAWVRSHLHILGLDEPTRRKLHTGELALSTALELVKIPAAERSDVLERMEKAGEKPTEERVRRERTGEKRVSKTARYEAALRAIVSGEVHDSCGGGHTDGVCGCPTLWARDALGE